MSIEVIPNARDLGGHRTLSGRTVRAGRVYRAAALSASEYSPILAELGVTHVYDLRTSAERDNAPDVLPERIVEVQADLLADQPEAGPATLGQIARAALVGDTAAMDPEHLDAIFVHGYRSFVTMRSARAVAQRLLEQLAEPDGGAVLVHCTAGKDRTGWLSALVLSALDVPWDAVLADYLASGPEVEALFAPYREQFAARGGDVSAMERAIGVYPHYLEASFETMRKEYDSIDGYLADGLALPVDFRERLAERLLTD